MSKLSRVQIYLRLAVCFVVLTLAAGQFGDWHFLLDLASHLRIQLILALVLAGLGLLLVKDRIWSVASLAFGVLLVALLFPFYWPSGVSGKSEYRLLVMNVLTKNDQKGEVAAYIKKMDPDFVALLETDENWVQSMESSLGKEWRYQKKRPRADNFGIVFLSKVPFDSCELIYFREEGSEAGRAVPSISAQFVNGDRKFRIIATHPLPPVGSTYSNLRNQSFQSLAKEIGKSDNKKRTIVCGDLNCTPWSVWFQRLLKESGLRNGGHGFGIGVTWTPFGTQLLGLPIDHVLVGKKVRVHGRTVGPNLGSDHRPIVMDFSIEK